MAKLGFKDFLAVDYAPGMPDLIKKNAKKRKQDTTGGSNAEYSSTHTPRVDEVSQALGHKVAKARQAQASALRQKAVDEPDMMKAFTHTKAANKAERKAGQSYNRLMRKEEVEELDEALTSQQRRARARLFKKYKARIKLGRERAKRRFASPEKLKMRSRRKARDFIFRRITKDIPKSELTFARRQEIEKRLESPAVKKRIERLAIKFLPRVRKAEMEKKRKAPPKK
jgi:hypothetical protein